MNTKFLPFQVEFSNLSPGRVKINSFDIKQGFRPCLEVLEKMKSLNVKKIAVAAIGAAMIGAAFAGAVTVPSSLSSYQFFSNGSPQVKIVVGTAAQPSDAVAAANIAAMIGNLAYTSTPVSINGESGLACSGSAGTATCSGGSATIQVTTPGINPATAYQMTTLINSALNADYTSSLTSQQRAQTSGLSNQITSFQNAPFTSDNVNAQITPYQTPVLKKTTLNIGGNSITEEEDIYAGATNSFSSTTNSIQSPGLGAYYVATFTNPLPLCTNTANNVTTCDASGNQQLINDTVNTIEFLGQPWVVEQFNNGVINANSSNPATSLELGQQTAYVPQLYIGQSETAPNGVKVTLNSITGASGAGNQGFYASFNVTATDGTTQIVTMNEQSYQTVDGVTIHVGKVFPGLTSGVQYAEVSIYSNQLTLSGTGGRISGTLDYGNWYSRFTDSTNGQSEAISNIVVYPSIASLLYNNAVPGTSFSLIQGSPLYNLNYVGLTNVTYTPLTFQIVQNMQVPVNQSGCTGTLTFDAILVTASSNSNILYDKDNSNYFSSGYIVYNPVNASSSNCSVSNAAIGDFYYLPTSSTTGYYTKVSAGDIQFRYSSAMSNWPTFSYSGNSSGGYVGINETTQGADGASFQGLIQAYVSKNQNAFVDGPGSTTSDSIFYNDNSGGSVAYSNSLEKQGFITDRGSVITGVSSNSISINYANQLAGVIYTLTPSGVNASTSNTANYTLLPGQTQSLGDGYSISLVSVGSGTSTTTGGNATVTGISGLTTTPATAETVVPLNTASTPLVEFDSQASTTQPLIVVGGPMVNTIAASLASQGSVSLNAPGDAVVQQIGNDILVAGYTAADTQNAANALINWLAQNAASITQ